MPYGSGHIEGYEMIPACLATSAWRERPARAVFYQQQGERFGFGPPAFQQEMLAKLERGERLW